MKAVKLVSLALMLPLYAALLLSVGRFAAGLESGVTPGQLGIRAAPLNYGQDHRVVRFAAIPAAAVRAQPQPDAAVVVDVAPAAAPTPAAIATPTFQPAPPTAIRPPPDPIASNQDGDDHGQGKKARGDQPSALRSAAGSSAPKTTRVPEAK